MNSIMSPLLAAAVALIPSNGPVPTAQSRVQASAAASATIVEAYRVDWERERAWLVLRHGPHGETRYDLEFQ
jgi:hypothetical protein